MGVNRRTVNLPRFAGSGPQIIATSVRRVLQVIQMSGTGSRKESRPGAPCRARAQEARERYRDSV